MTKTTAAAAAQAATPGTRIRMEVNMSSSRSSMALLAGAFIGALAVGSASSVQALPLPVPAAALAGDKSVDQVADRGGSDADRFDGRGGHRRLHRDRGAVHHSGAFTAGTASGATARSPSGCESHADQDSMDYCGYHIGEQ
jgi:hypothetical protein